MNGSAAPAEHSRRQLVATLLRAFQRSTIHVASFNHAVASQLGIGPTDLDCLILLQSLGPTPAGHLADVLNLTTGAITGVVDRLVVAGFVTRESDPTDRRRVIVCPVAERLLEVDRAFGPLHAAAEIDLATYSDHDLRVLLDFQSRASALIEEQAARLRADQATTGASASFAAPLGGLTAASLEFGSAASELRIGADAQLDRLFFAVFDGPQPAVRMQNGMVSVRYRRMSLFDWSKHAATVALNPTIVWTIALRGGVSNARLDLGNLHLCELLVGGGASKLEVTLPSPSGTCRVCIDGGVNRVQIHRPAGNPVELLIRGGANRLEFDAQRFGAIGGDVRLASPEWEQATDRYVIDIRGGASRLDIYEL
jgi:DNA-binding MarR family transcriptional regulator